MCPILYCMYVCIKKKNQSLKSNFMALQRYKEIAQKKCECGSSIVEPNGNQMSIKHISNSSVGPEQTRGIFKYMMSAKLTHFTQFIE